MQRRVILYELNEVPWEIVDLYCRARPASHFSAFVGDSLCRTTINEDPGTVPALAHLAHVPQIAVH